MLVSPLAMHVCSGRKPERWQEWRSELLSEKRLRDVVASVDPGVSERLVRQRREEKQGSRQEA